MVINEQTVFYLLSTINTTISPEINGKNNQNSGKHVVKNAHGQTPISQEKILGTFIDNSSTSPFLEESRYPGSSIKLHKHDNTEEKRSAK